jgi:hypothetical protein
VVLLAWASFLCPGCESGAGGGATHTVRDSAGVEIVESASPAWREGEAWRVDSVPLLDVSGRDDEELFRVGSPVVLGDGRLALFNGGACEVRFYDRDGNRAGAVGRCGEGPGEYEESARLWPWRGDSIVVVDRLMRVTVLGEDGAYGRTVLLHATTDMPLPLIRGVLANGTLVVTGPRDPIGRASPGVEAGETSLGLLRDLEGEPQLVGTYPGPVFEYTEFDGRLGRGALAFSSSTQFTSGDGRLFVGFPDRYEIRVHGSDGILQRIMRRPFERVAVTQRDVDWLMERRLAQVEGADNQRAVRQAFRDLRHAELMPAFGVPVWPGGAAGGPAMIADAAGNLWVFVHYRPGEYRNQWTVFSPDGAWLGTVTLPDALTPSQIGPEFVLGQWVDDDEFVHVRRYRLIKP